MRYIPDNRHFRQNDNRFSLAEFEKNSLHSVGENMKKIFSSSDASSSFQKIIPFLFIIDLIAFVIFTALKLIEPDLYALLLNPILISLAVIFEKNTSASYPEDKPVFKTGKVNAVILLLLTFTAAAAVFLHFRKIFILTLPLVMKFLFAVLAGIALSLIMGTITGPIFKKIKCRESDFASCVGFDDKIISQKSERGGRYYLGSAPVYELISQGRKYTVFDGFYEEDSIDLPKIGDKAPIRFDPKNPNTCLINNKSQIHFEYIFTAIVLIIFSVGCIFLGNINISTGQKHKRNISDSFIAKAYGYSRKNTPGYTVYKRNITAIEDDDYIFSTTGDLADRITLSDADYSIGDSLYWVQSEDDKVILLNTEKYYYKGSNTPEHSEKFDDDGKFILTSDYFDQCFGEEWDLLDTTLSEISEDRVLFISDNGQLYNLKINKDEINPYSEDSVGKKYYYVRYAGNARTYDKLFYTYNE